MKAITRAPMTPEQAALSMPMELYKYPVEIQKSVVAILACCGTPLYVLAVFLRMSEGSVNDNFADTLANCKQIANSRVAGSLFNTALYGEDPRSKVTAAIFWLKAQGRWREDGSTPSEKPETQNVVPLTNLSDSQFARIRKIVQEAKPEDRKAARNPSRLLEPEVIPPKKGGKRNGKA